MSIYLAAAVYPAIACAQWVDVKDCKIDFYDLTVPVSPWLDNYSEPYLLMKG